MFIMQKGPHLRTWLDMCHAVLQSDPWLITDRYNEDAAEIDSAFVDNRHDQSIMSVSRKIIEYKWFVYLKFRNATIVDECPMNMCILVWICPDVLLSLAGHVASTGPQTEHPSAASVCLGTQAARLFIVDRAIRC